MQLHVDVKNIAAFVCNSCNIGMRALSEMLARLPEARRPEGGGHTFTFQANLDALCHS